MRTLLPIRAGDLHNYGYFRKRGGTMVYKKFSESTVKYLKLDPNKTYGVCYNGNVADVPNDAVVMVCTEEDYFHCKDDEIAWNRAFSKEPNALPYDVTQVRGGDGEPTEN